MPRSWLLPILANSFVLAPHIRPPAERGSAMWALASTRAVTGFGPLNAAPVAVVIEDEHTNRGRNIFVKALAALTVDLTNYPRHRRALSSSDLLERNPKGSLQTHAGLTVAKPDVLYDNKGSPAWVFDAHRTIRVAPALPWPHHISQMGVEGTSGNAWVGGSQRLEKVTRMPRWRVDVFRKQAEHLGIVTAPNAQEGLNRAASLFRIHPAQYSKLMTSKIEEYEVGRYADWMPLHRIAS